MARVEDTQLSAVRQIQERQGGVGSFLFVNPVESIKAFLSPWAIPYGIWAHKTGSMFVGLPVIFAPSLVFHTPISKFMGNLLGKNPLMFGPQFGTMLVGGGGFFGGGASLSQQIGLEQKQVKVFIKEFRRALKGVPFGKFGDTTGVMIVEKLVGKLKTSAPNVADILAKQFISKPAVITKIIKTSLIVKTAGAILWPYMLASTTGLVVARGMDLAFKAGMSALNMARAASEHVRALEFGGTLGAGYMTQEAATERQRAVKMMQRNHISGRRALGAEAMNYSMLI